LGASLIVALNSDASAKRLGKGADRPVNTLADRAAVIAALGCVDRVTWFESDTPLELILAVKPYVLVKGGDWKPDAIVGAREVQAWGGSVHSIAFAHQRSTTALLEKVRATETR
jgi:rfaE bifunctional protein nucleotidyltransferase chain/domain